MRLLPLLLLLLLPAFSQQARRADVAIVLGAAQYDGKPSPVFTRRLQEALRLFRRGVVKLILVSGGKAKGDRYSEGEAGCRYLYQHGVNEQNLLCETESRSTWENLLFSKPLLAGRTALIVSDAPHLPRALLLARRLGINAQGWPVNGSYPLSYRLRESVLYELARLGITH